jgi:hypothetical protein
MKYLLFLLLTFNVFASDLPELAFGGDAYLSLENWSNVGAQDDSKMGIGIAGDLGIGIKMDDMKILVGPHLGYNSWTQDYSNKAHSVTSSVYVSMMDTGMVLIADMDDFVMKLGVGSSTLGMGYTVGNQTYKYPTSGTTYGYKYVGFGFNMKPLIFGIGFTTYSELKAANRCEFSIGVGF